MNYLRDAWEKTFCYTGRASRKEYWMAVLWYVISVVVAIVAMVLMRFPMGLPIFVREVVFGWLSYLLLFALMFYFFASFFVFLALQARRIHDIGLSAWWLLLDLVPLGGLVIFIFTVIEGNAGDNKYGPDPLAPSVAVS